MEEYVTHRPNKNLYGKPVRKFNTQVHLAEEVIQENKSSLCRREENDMHSCMIVILLDISQML